MKKAFSFFALVAILFLTSCSTFRDEPDVSVWAKGLWLVFWLPFLGSLWFFYLSYRASKSGSEVLPNSHGIKPYKSDINVPIYKLAKFWGAVVLQLFAWGTVIYFNSDWHR